jgi:hypothetical protein
MANSRAALTRFTPFSYFLNLLERHAQGVGEVCLAYTERVPALAQPSADK